MKRTQIYLDQEQHEFLENLAFLNGRKSGRKVSISEVIRSAIDLLKNNYAPGTVKTETERILRDGLNLSGTRKGKGEKKLSSHKKLSGKPKC
jgi:Arc/MetJ-type ribon-helix-helix transcriptional regulator